MSFDPVADAGFSLDIDAVKGRSRIFDTRRFYKTLEYFAQYGPVSAVWCRWGDKDLRTDERC